MGSSPRVRRVRTVRAIGARNVLHELAANLQPDSLRCKVDVLPGWERHRAAEHKGAVGHAVGLLLRHRDAVRCWWRCRNFVVD